MRKLCRNVALLLSVAGAAPAYAQTATETAEASINATPGTLLPSGLGQFGDPVALRGLVFGVQAGLGSSSSSPTFGYDDLSVSLRWRPGTNAIGRRLSVLAGVADWHTPAFSRVYPDSLLDGLADADRLAAATSNSAAFGLSVILFGDRAPSPSQAEWARFKTTRDSLDKLIVNASQLRKAELEAERAQLKWTRYLRPVLRKPTLTVGALIQSEGFVAEAQARALDGYLVAAAGRGLLDAVFAYHRLEYLTDDVIARYANIASAGVFLDLADQPPVPVLGLSIGYGDYRFRELHELISEADVLQLTPHTRRLDVVLSLSGAPSQNGGPSAGVGLKFSRIRPEYGKRDNLLTIQFSTNFKLFSDGS